MITRFRIEGENESKLDLQDELVRSGHEIIRMVNPGAPAGSWKITDDVVSYDRNRGVHIGRVVYAKQ